MRVGIYVRVSTDDKGQNLDTQRMPLREFCTAQGWTEVTEYADEASATNLRGRVQWRRLLDDCAKRKVDLVLVWRLDRASRSVLDAAQTLERLRAWGVASAAIRSPGSTPPARSVRHCTTSPSPTRSWSAASCASA